MASAPAKLARVRASVRRNPEPKAPRLWTRTLTFCGSLGAGGRRRRRGHRRGWADRRGWGRRGGSLDRADLLAVEVGHALDRVVVLPHHDVLAGDVVGAGEVDDLLASVVDGVGGRHHVDLALLEGDLPPVRWSLDEVDVLG